MKNAGDIVAAAVAACRPRRRHAPAPIIFTGDAKPFIAEGDRARRGVRTASLSAGWRRERILTIAGGPDSGISPACRMGFHPWAWRRAVRRYGWRRRPCRKARARTGHRRCIAFDLGNGGMRKIYPVPDPGLHVLNDLALAPDGTVYLHPMPVEGSLYRLAPGDRRADATGKSAASCSIRRKVMAVSSERKIPAGGGLFARPGQSLISRRHALLSRCKFPKGVNAKGIDGLCSPAGRRFSRQPERPQKSPHSAADAFTGLDAASGAGCRGGRRSSRRPIRPWSWRMQAAPIWSASANGHHSIRTGRHPRSR